MAGSITLGLYNSYDARRFHEPMRRAAARAGALCQAFGDHLALIGFPFSDYRLKDGSRPDPRTPAEVARVLDESTSIGQEGHPTVALADAGRLHVLGFPARGFPPQFGRVVLATARPEASKRVDAHEVALWARQESVLVVVGLGPRGVPKEVHEMAEHHWDATGVGASLETATAMGAVMGALAEARRKPEAPRMTADAVVVDGDRVLLVRRAREPFAGQWALPGGFVDSYESPEEAVVRELAEETGLSGRVASLVGVFSRRGRDPRGPTTSFAYLVEAEGEPRAGDDAAEAAWHAVADPPALAFDHAEILKAALGS